MDTSAPIIGEVFIVNGNTAILQANGNYEIEAFNGDKYRLVAGDDYEVAGKVHTRYSLRRLIGGISEVNVWDSSFEKGKVPYKLLGVVTGTGVK